MPVAWNDVYRAVRARNWPIQDAWQLVAASTDQGMHPDVHVAFLQDSIDADVHFRTQTDFKGKEYRDRGRHSMFRNVWEAAGAVCMAMNSDAGEAALVAVKAGTVVLKSRSALIGGPQSLERLQIAVHGKVSGVSFFDLPAEFAVLVLLYSGGDLLLKTAYPSRGAADGPPPGRDLVSGGGTNSTYPARA